MTKYGYRQRGSGLVVERDGLDLEKTRCNASKNTDEKLKEEQGLVFLVLGERQKKKKIIKRNWKKRKWNHEEEELWNKRDER